MRNLAGLWRSYPCGTVPFGKTPDRARGDCRFGLEIIWRDQGWQELAGELVPDTIGAELQEWEQQEAEV